MKKILFVLTFACFSTMAIAQRGVGDRFFEKVKAELNLTTAQTDELKELKIERQQAIEKMRADGIHPRDEAGRAFFDKEKEKMMAILTPEQRTKLEAISAERKAHHKSREAKHKAARQELENYRDTEITPVLVQQREKLDKEISRKDRKTIAAIRLLSNAYRSEKKAEFEKKKAAHKAAKEEGKISEHAPERKRGPRHHHKGKHGHRKGHGFKGFQEKYPTEAAQLETLVAKYDTDIARVIDEIENERAAWKAKKEEHMSENRGDNKRGGKNCESKENCKKGGNQNEGDRAERRAEHMAQKETDKKIRFLLLDPDTDVAALDNIANTNVIRSVHNTNVFPNPATNNQTITFDVAKSGDVLLEVIDKKGKVVKQVHSGTMAQGNQNITVDISDLKGFIFYYRITDASGVSSTKFMTKN